VRPGVFKFANSANGDLIAQANVCADCYIVDDNTVALTDGGGTRSRAGKIVGVDSDGVWVVVGPYPIPGATYVTLTGIQTLTNKTLTAPTLTAPVIADFTSAAHDHGDADDGGKIVAAGVAQGTARQVLRTNAGATASEWGAVGFVSAAAPAFAAGDCAITPNPGTIYILGATAAPSTVSITKTNLVAGDVIGFSGDGVANGHTVTYRDGVTAITAAKTASKRHAVMMVYDGTNLCVIGEVSP